MRSLFSVLWERRERRPPVGALEAGDLMGETPRGKKARYAEPADQTPDQKAEEIAQERGARALDSKFNKFKGREVPAGVKHFSTPESEEIDNHARKIECGTLVLEPEGTWREMKKSLCCKFKEPSLPVDASMAYDQKKELEKTVDYESFMRECLACESVYTTIISNLEIPGLPVCLFELGGTNGTEPCESNVASESHA